jgi:hypothetical protein
MMHRALALLAVIVLSLAVHPAWADPGKQYTKQDVIGEGQLKGLKYIACSSSDQVVALLNDGTVKVFDKTGKVALEFASKLDKPAVVACDAKGNIYVVAPKSEIGDLKTSNGTIKMKMTVGAYCRVFDSAGKQTREVTVGDLRSITSGKIADGKLFLADFITSTVGVYDLDTGAKTATIGKGVRTCCGILGFAVDAKQNIVIASLGAFHVDTYDAAGKLLNSFGKRGSEVLAFHGCCNPANLVVLPDGRLMTAEKDKTRIKIYDAEGKVCEQVVADVAELVDGCAFIPMAMDSTGNVYLANTNKDNIVKCGPKP